MKKIIFIIVLGTIIIGGAVILLNKAGQPTPQPESQLLQEVEKKEISLVIDDGEAQKTFKTNIQEEMTAFDLLEEGAEKLNLSLETKSYDIGIFIEAIGERKNGQDGKYWLYYVNGEMPMMAADKNIIKAGDKVEFKFEKSPF